jgi:hypothetical protein
MLTLQSPSTGYVHCSDLYPEFKTRAPGTAGNRLRLIRASLLWRRNPMNGIIYLVGLVVIVMFILSFFGLR